MKYNFWFVVGSQDLYGEEVLKTVAERATEMAAEMSLSLPYPLALEKAFLMSDRLSTGFPLFHCVTSSAEYLASAAADSSVPK